MAHYYDNSSIYAEAPNGQHLSLITDKGSFTGKSPEASFFSPYLISLISAGQFPDLRETCLNLLETFNLAEVSYSARQLVPVMKAVPELEPQGCKGFLKSRTRRHVLLSNENVELVLHLWKPGQASDVHGHPGGGCVYKLLLGKLEEIRYTPEPRPRLMSMHHHRKGSVDYIDDSVAYHMVGNPYGSPAISLHAYLK
jgi:hypothetical protein